MEKKRIIWANHVPKFGILFLRMHHRVTFLWLQITSNKVHKPLLGHYYSPVHSFCSLKASAHCICMQPTHLRSIRHSKCSGLERLARDLLQTIPHQSRSCTKKERREREEYHRETTQSTKTVKVSRRGRYLSQSVSPQSSYLAGQRERQGHSFLFVHRSTN